MAVVTKIPASVSKFTASPMAGQKKRKVAGYARVSTDHDDQFTSYEAQIDYYTNYIKSRPDWEFVAVYTDEGITGCNTLRREGFKKMVADAIAGRIDLIVTKSVSRFARNTVDSLTTIRKLKAHGTEVYFEKENIWTFDGKGELLLTIMSSLAQEESRSISENCIWGQRKRFADGKVTVPFSKFLGYDMGPDRNLVVNPEQAKLVKRIYGMFLQGHQPCQIARTLTEEGIPTPGGKTRWNTSTIKSILTNEKYKGDALLQKTFTVDFLTKKKKTNKGEIPQYYVKGNHEAIIDPEIFEHVQAMMLSQSSDRRSFVRPFSSRVKCGCCGGWYGSKVWHSTDKHRRIVWQCNNKFKGETKCRTPHIEEQEIKSRFVSVINSLLPDKQALLEDCRLMQDALTDCTKIDEQLDALVQELEVIAGLTRKCIAENAAEVIDQGEYKKRYDGLNARYDTTREKIEALEKKKAARIGEADKIGAFMFEMLECDEPLDTFDERLWIAVIDHATVYHDGRIVFTFVNGMEAEG